MIWVITIYLNVETIGGKIITMIIRNKIILKGLTSNVIRLNIDVPNLTQLQVKMSYV